MFGPDGNLWTPPGDAYLNVHLLGGDDLVGGGPGGDRLYGDEGFDRLDGGDMVRDSIGGLIY